LEEPRIPDDLDGALQGDAELDYDKPIEEPVPAPPPSNEAEIGNGQKKRSKVRARRAVPPLSLRQTRARSRSLSIQPDAVPVASRTTSRAKTKATVSTADAAVLKPVPESQVFDEFVAHSNEDDEGEMHEVEANLRITAHSRGSCLSHIQLYYIVGLCFDSSGMCTAESPVGNQTHNFDIAEDFDDDSDDNDELLNAFVKKMDKHPPPVPASNLKRSGHRDRDQRSSSEEIFPSPGTRARAEKKRRTQVAKAAPYVPPKGTRAASMIAKGTGTFTESRSDDSN
jgi:hypothetical protein